MKTYKYPIIELPENGIFVFGSNTQGRHGKGAALIAKQKFGAIYGQSVGLQGKSYGIVTKDLTKKQHPSVPKIQIVLQIVTLYTLAKGRYKDKLFFIAYNTNPNLNGYSPKEMAEMFSYNESIPDNIIFEEEFSKLLTIS